MSKLFVATLLLTLLDLGTPSPVWKRSLPYPLSSHSSALTRSRSTSQPSSKWLREQLVGQVAIDSEYAGLAFLTNITFGNEDFAVTIDTGSSDTCESLGRHEGRMLPF